MKQQFFSAELKRNPNEPIGPATGEPTDVVVLKDNDIDPPPEDEIKAEKANPAKKAAKKVAKKRASKKELAKRRRMELCKKAYELYQVHQDWKPVGEELETKTSHLMASQYAKQNGLVYPPPPSEPVPEPVAEEPEAIKETQDEPPPQPEPVAPPKRVETYKLFKLSEHPEIRATTRDQKWLLRFDIAGKQVDMALTDDNPSERYILRVIEREERKRLGLR